MSGNIDSELILAVKNGDSEAFHKLYILLFNKVYFFITRTIKSRADCDEIVQIVFVKLWENHKNIDLNKSFYGYIFTIAKNCVIDFHKNILLKKIIDCHPTNTNINGQYSEDIDSKDILNKLINFMEDIPPQRRRAFLLHKVYGLSHKEISKKMNISENTVETHIRLVIKYLRNNFKNFINFIFF